MQQLNAPYGGALKQLIDADSQDKLKLKARKLKSLDLNRRQLCDLELLLNGAFSPLEGFMSQSDYQSVVDDMRLADGRLWPMPITLDVKESFANELELGDEIALLDQEGVPIALLSISDIWQPNKELEASAVFGTLDSTHPAVHYLMNSVDSTYLGGQLTSLDKPTHYDYRALRDTPAELRAKFDKLGWKKVVAFQTRNPMHRAHQELTFRAARELEANLLIQPVVGMTKAGDLDHFCRVRCYELLLEHYPEQTTALSLLPLAMRMAGPKEALLHAIIRKNYGCSHIIIGRDHAGPGDDADGTPFYGAYEAQELMKKHQAELGIEMVPFQKMVYIQERAEYLPINEVDKDMTVMDISGSELRRRLKQGLDIPEWYSYPEIIAELRKTKPARFKQGFTIFFTGLSGSGKSTIANALLIKLLEVGDRPVTLLDGDVVRKNLSSELGFSKEHRNLNIERIGFVASEITKNGGIAICAPIAPYSVTRRKVKEVINEVGGFVEVYVSTPIEECERRDRKGLYAKARAGIIKDFTGISDPYEVPQEPELEINTLDLNPDNAAHKIILKLEQLGYIK